jgi:hypothetical protein
MLPLNKPIYKPYSSVSQQRNSQISRILNDKPKMNSLENLQGLVMLLSLDTSSTNFLTNLEQLAIQHPIIEELCAPIGMIGQIGYYVFRNQNYRLQRFTAIIDQLKAGIDTQTQALYFQDEEIKNLVCSKACQYIAELEQATYSSREQAKIAKEQINELTKFTSNIGYTPNTNTLGLSTNPLISKHNAKDTVTWPEDNQLIIAQYLKPYPNYVIYGNPEHVTINGERVQELQQQLLRQLKINEWIPIISKQQLNSKVANAILQQHQSAIKVQKLVRGIAERNELAQDKEKYLTIVKANQAIIKQKRLEMANYFRTTSFSKSIKAQIVNACLESINELYQNDRAPDTIKQIFCDQYNLEEKEQNQHLGNLNFDQIINDLVNTPKAAIHKSLADIYLATKGLKDKLEFRKGYFTPANATIRVPEDENCLFHCLVFLDNENQIQQKQIVNDQYSLAYKKVFTLTQRQKYILSLIKRGNLPMSELVQQIKRFNAISDSPPYQQSAGYPKLSITGVGIRYSQSPSEVETLEFGQQISRQEIASHLRGTLNKDVKNAIKNASSLTVRNDLPCLESSIKDQIAALNQEKCKLKQALGDLERDFVILNKLKQEAEREEKSPNRIPTIFGFSFYIMPGREFKLRDNTQELRSEIEATLKSMKQEKLFEVAKIKEQMELLDNNIIPVIEYFNEEWLEKQKIKQNEILRDISNGCIAAKDLEKNVAKFNEITDIVGEEFPRLELTYKVHGNIILYKTKECPTGETIFDTSSTGTGANHILNRRFNLRETNVRPANPLDSQSTIFAELLSGQVEVERWEELVNRYNGITWAMGNRYPELELVRGENSTFIRYKVKENPTGSIVLEQLTAPELAIN